MGVSNFDNFWERMVDEGILGPDAAGRARARHAQFGGGLDTAVYEFSTLDQSEKAYVLHAAADVVGLPVAETEYLDAPDFEALARIDRNLLRRFPVLPSRDACGISIVIVPALLNHELKLIRAALTSDVKLYLGCEIDIWEALSRYALVELPKRIESIWLGQSPGMSGDTDGDLCGPTAVPRSTVLYVAPGAGLPAGQVEHSNDFVAQYGEGNSPITRPGRPQALGLADTADFEEKRQQTLLKRRSYADEQHKTADDLAELARRPQRWASNTDIPADQGQRKPTADTIPPATG